MYYTREQHKRFLDKELTAISEEYLQKLQTKATALLSKNEVYVTQFVKLNQSLDLDSGSSVVTKQSGQFILRFKKERGIPRRNEYFTAIVLDGKMSLPKNWGDLAWGKLRSFQVEFSEVHCVWQGKADDKGFLVCGFSGLSIEMARYLTENNLQGCVVVLGPQEPPMDYYQNLISIVSNEDPSMPAKSLLDFDKKGLDWNPLPINSDSSNVAAILEHLKKQNELIFQGPPGTGKTYLMAALVGKLLEEHHSVLVTAMTNRALIELAQKNSLKPYLSDGKIAKTNVSADELSECKNLNPVNSKEITCISGAATLSTFYNTSGWAKVCYNEQPFDYVIMDEASQSLYGMIAACKNLGKKIIWIGDQEQMQPIVKLSDETLIRNNFSMLANGFRTLCENFKIHSFVLNETHRLLPNAAALTSVFYHMSLKSVADFSYVLGNIELDSIPKNGGCSLRFCSMPIGEKADRNACQETINIVSSLLKVNSKLEIAVLSKFRATVRMLQNCLISTIGNTDNVLIDTVERVQGMTCDVCIFFVPNTMMSMSLERSLFNVATSRAKQLTVIVADRDIVNVNCDYAVQQFMGMVLSNNYTSKQTVNHEQAGVKEIDAKAKEPKIVGYVDLSKFERKKKEIVNGKTNIYIIDTNVFVKSPDIIAKIDKEYPVILSAKVVDELDKLKITLDTNGQKAVQDALRSINRSFEARNLKMEVADVDLLPMDFNKKSPDNQIVAVALKHLGGSENPIILTSDNGLQLKAKGLGVTTISLKDFLKKPK